MESNAASPVPSRSVSARTWEPLLTPAEAAALLRVHPKTALRFARSQGLPAIRVGKHWRFRESDLTSWADSQVESSRQLSERSES